MNIYSRAPWVIAILLTSSLASANVKLTPAEQALLRQADERSARVRGDAHTQQQRDTTRANNQGRCAQLEIDRRMLEDQIQRTGWQLEQDLAKARLQEAKDSMRRMHCQ